MEKGIRFYMKDGSLQDYDPCVEFEELDAFYSFYVIGCHYEILKENVINYEFYPLCEKHGYENSEKYKCNDCELEN